ncbi:MAG: 4Fe-4S cluster-binding domain-containing protein [Candidatus Aminicenantes bacterium]|nr:4Fe-4S cluster-binding domain-containing protein [Candidatus Aminicenantes bacterium]
MEFSDFTITVTSDCDFSCSYCYQKREKEYLDITIARRAIDFFFPFLADECFINFYGGEPLLSIEQIKEVVSFIQYKNRSLKKKIQYSITSNGNFINKDVLQFLNNNSFTFMLSFDGLAQDVSRKKGSFDHLCSNLKKLLECPEINLETNSVFTSQTVGYLSQSVQFIVESGVQNVNLSFSNLPPWNRFELSRLKREMASLREYSLSIYRETGKVPVTNLRKIPSKGVFSCSAGKDRMALSPDGSLWGCCFFSDFYKSNGKTEENGKYCFGNVESFIENHKKVYLKVLKNYSDLRMQYFFTSKSYCTLCEDVRDCVVCPVDAALGSAILGKIPDWVCRIRKILRAERKLFLEDAERI